MTRTRRPRLVVAAALAATGLALAPAAATADPIFPEPGRTSAPAPRPAPVTSRSCSITAPARVAVASRATTLTLTLAGDCPAGAWAAWDLVGPRGTVARYTFPPAAPRTVTLPARAALGTYRLGPVTAHDAADRLLTQNRPTFVVGARARTATTATRAGRAVTVSATATAWSPTADAFAPRARTRVFLQRSTCASGCTWSAAGSAVTDARGRVVLRAASAPRAYWRTYVPGTAVVFGSVSAALRA